MHEDWRIKWVFWMFHSERSEFFSTIKTSTIGSDWFCIARLSSDVVSHLVSIFSFSFQEVTVSEPENSVSLYWQGRVYWQQGDETRRDRSKCLDAFMKVSPCSMLHVYQTHASQTVGCQASTVRRKFGSRETKKFDG